ncbi:MAG: cysteine desulfurase [Acidobacteriota bacterium]
MNVNEIRKDFPILSVLIRGKPLIYLDNAATTQKPVSVIEAISEYYKAQNSNVHRGIYLLSEEATKNYEDARFRIAKFINAPSFKNIIFVRNTTEAINLVAYAWARKFIGEGDEILLTEMEHHSNLIPWQFISREKKAKLKFIPVLEDGTLDSESIEKLLTEKTKIVALTHMSNVLGTINPVKEITKLAHKNNSLVLIDGAQSAPHFKVDVQDIDCDFFAFSGHKMLGPMGIGILFAKEKILEEMDPFMGGGEMISQVWYDRATFNELPWKFEAGTPNVSGAIGLKKAVDYLEKLGMDNVRNIERELTFYALEKMKELDDIILYGPMKEEIRGGVISFNFRTIHSHDVGTVLDYEGIAIRAGHHCAQPLMRKLNVPATVRASFYIYNEKEEIDILMNALKKVREIFSHGIR